MYVYIYTKYNISIMLYVNYISIKLGKNFSRGAKIAGLSYFVSQL